MTNSVPFDPPYKAKVVDAEGERWVAVQVDGSSVPTAAPLLISSPGPFSNEKSSAPASKSPKAAAVLNVPFAEKDEAKQLGARWDATKKKWYVPHGVDPALFERWSK